VGVGGQSGLELHRTFCASRSMFIS